MQSWHTLQTEQVFQQAETAPAGLTDHQVVERSIRYGKNRIEEKKPIHPLRAFFLKFTDFMILVLLAAAVIAGIAGDLTDTIVILLIVVLNALVGFIQEYKAEKAMESIRRLAALQVTVIRNGQTVQIPSEDLVPGDVLLLESGNIVGADVRLIEANRLFADEAMLTGESFAVQKSTTPLQPADRPLGDRTNMAYKGTQITGGKGRGLVVDTGMQTELGRIASLLNRKEGETPLQRRMAEFSKKLSYIILFICIALFFIGYLRHEEPIQLLLTTISLAVAAIPEALPALITIALARGAKKLVAKNVLTRKLNAVETLGSVTYICSDKTGTLTQNKMTVVVAQAMGELLPTESDMPMLDRCMALNQDVAARAEGNWSGDPTEIALVEHYLSIHGKQSLSDQQHRFRRIEEIPFDAAHKSMTTLHAFGARFLLVTKGAEETLSRQWAPSVNGQSIHDTVSQLATKGMRVIVYGYKILDSKPDMNNAQSIEQDLLPAGLVAMIDPPRQEVKQAIDECKTAGIQPVMITGDHPQTAATIATQIGLLGPHELTITGEALNQLDEATFLEQVEKIRVYARVSPEQKLRIVTALQQKGHYVAMTGDGVNDAPSLKAANIGVAMGISGTDVSKQVAKMILLDDHFASIVNGVREGRRIYDNIRKFVKYIMTCNSAEIWTLMLAPLFGLPIPLLPIHILWINLVTDGIPALTLANEKAEPDLMKKPPRDPNEGLFAHGMGIHILWVGLLMAAITLAVQAWSLNQASPHWQTMVFTVLSLCQLAHVLAIRQEQELGQSGRFFTNPFLILGVLASLLLQLIVLYLPLANQVLKTAPLTLNELLICLAGAGFLFLAVEVEKKVKKRFKRTPSAR